MNNQARIPSLDGIRGLAAMIVFAAHAGLDHIVPGGFGVTVFFFLSGYLITTLLRIEYEKRGRINFKAFYLRRIYRILPPMYIVLVLAMALGFAGVFEHRMTGEALFAQLAHVTNYYDLARGSEHFAPGTGVMWSLAVEEHFYLVFPLALSLLLATSRYRTIAAILATACVAVLAWRLALIGFAPAEYTYKATDARIDSILYGCILAMWYNPALDKRRVSNMTGVALVTVGAVAIVASLLYRDPAFRETWRYTIQGLALLPLFYCAVKFSHWPVFAWLDSKPMQLLGLVSYTFYLVHLLCLGVAAKFVDSPVIIAAVGLAATLAVSALMYFAVERHMAALRHKLHSSAIRVQNCPHNHERNEQQAKTQKRQGGIAKNFKHIAP